MTNTILNGILNARNLHNRNEEREVASAKRRRGDVRFVKMLIMVTLAVLSTASARSETETVDGISWTYEIKDGKATVGDWYHTAVPRTTTGAIAIPSVLGGCPVTCIGGRAFYDCWELTSVAIPEGVTNIGTEAFIYCNRLSVTLPSSVKSVGSGAFYGCNKISVADLVKWCSISFDGVVFDGCSIYHNGEEVRDLIIPDGITQINSFAFAWCDGLKSVTMPSSVKNIGEYAFGGCSGLTSVTIPSSVMSIEGYAFSECSGLTSVTIPSSVMSIGEYAFSDCGKLQSIELPNKLRRLENSVFLRCGNLAHIKLPESLEYIGDDSFSGTALMELVIPASVRTMGKCLLNVVTLRHLDFDGECPDSLKRADAWPIQKYSTFGDSWDGVWSPYDYKGGGFDGPFDYNLPLADIRAWAWNAKSFEGLAYSESGKYNQYNVPGYSSRTFKYRWSFSPEIIYRKDGVLEIDPPHGSILSGRTSVSIKKPHESIEVRYTLDGRDPMLYGEVYLSKFAVQAKKVTVRAIGMACGSVCTQPLTAQYGLGKVSAPDIECVGGTPFYFSRAEIRISCSTENVVIHYTTDGSRPTEDSPIYSAPLLVDETTTIKACAMGHETYIDSDVKELKVERIHLRVATPVISPGDGESFSTENCLVAISCETEGAEIHYTVDGTTPTSASPLYEGPFYISDTTTIMAGAKKDDYDGSYIATARIRNNQPYVTAPTIQLTSGGVMSCGSDRYVEIRTPTNGATIYYTIDGTTPTEHSLVYSAPFPITETTVVKAYATMRAHKDSSVSSTTIQRTVGAGDAINLYDYTPSYFGPAWEMSPVCHSQSFSLRSPSIGPSSSSSMEVTVYGAGMLSFWWQTSCEHDNLEEYYYDHAEFWVDGDLVAQLDGQTTWIEVVHNIVTSGWHVLRWKYIKDADDDVGEDCVWIDDVDLSAFDTQNYVVTFNANGGVCSAGSRAYEKNGSTLGALPLAVRDGYIFNGWYTESRGGTQVTETTVVTRNMMLYAHWRSTTDEVSIFNVEACLRYPRNGLVDITVTFCGVFDAVAHVECTFAATNSATKIAIPVEHITRNGDDVGSGTVWTRKFIWDAKADIGAVKIDDVELTVDVELPYVQLWENGPYWAKCNVGATKPEECGYYFWWGDAVGYKRNANNNGWISAKDSTGFSFGSGECPTYGKNNPLLQLEGYVDSTDKLVGQYDAATAYLGAPWRMPTDSELSALISNCTTRWTTCNGVSGRLVMGKGVYSSRSIFLPAAGLGNDTALFDHGSYGHYWSSSPLSDNSYLAWRLGFHSGDFYRRSSYRYTGMSVRPVRGFAHPSAAIGGVATHLSLDCQVSCHTITFDPNGGNCSVVSKSCENGALIGALPDATRNGYMFEGWYTAASGGMKVTIETIVTEDVTLYAHWVLSAGDIILSDIEVFSGYPWHEVVIGYRIAGSTDQLQTFEVTARDNATGKTYECKTLDGVSLTTGSHVIKWNASADGAKLKSENVVFTVRIVPSRPRYCVIDLSGGANAARYPVVWLEKMPSSGWTDEYKTKKLVLRRIEAGSFMMGGGLFNNEVLHSVVLTKPCYMGVFEVTQSQWELVMGANPSYHKNEMCPVECISYDMIRGSSAGAGWPSAKMVDASSFVGKLQEKTGLELDLPTEAQWEYACRAGTTTRYYWGSSIDGSYAWYRDNSESFSTHPVGTREANPWGLYDMSGNVWEWCLDWYVAGFSVETDPEGPDSGVKRVTRGGSSYENEYYCTSTVRESLVPSDRNALYGFRLVGLPQGGVSWIAAEEGVEALAEASSGRVALDTTHVDGTIVVRSVPIAYGSVVSVGCCITANGVEIVNSMMRGTKDWAPISGGEYKLVYSCGDVMMESVVAKIDSGNYTDAVVGKDVTGLDEPVTVSATWVTDFLVQHFGTGKEDSFRQLFGGDLAAALAKPTGKHGPSGEVRTVWDDYVAGTDPTDPASVFTTTIAIVDGKVVLDWSPNLNLGSVNRLYRVKSKLDLSDTWTCPPVADHHFFMTEVALPDGKTQTASPGVIGNASSDGDGEANKLAHRWSFNGNLNDSVGNRTATAVGSVSSDGSTYTLSGVSGTVAYIDLGTGLFANGVTEFTIETWVTPYATGWRRIWDMADLFGQCWNGKDNLMGVRDHVSWTSYTTDVKTYIAVVCTALPSGGWSLIYYHLDAETGSTLSSYASTTVGSDWSPQKVGVNALLLGKSNAPQDPYGNASYDEFRIWNKALSEDELKKSVEKGPDTLP